MAVLKYRNENGEFIPVAAIVAYEEAGDEPVVPDTPVVSDFDYKGFLEGTDTEVTIPEGVTKLRTHAFAYYHDLTKVNFPSTLTELGTSCFVYSGLAGDLVFPQGVIKMHSYALGHTDLENITLPSTLTTLDGEVFSSNQSLKTITFKSTPTDGSSSYNKRLSASLFYGCDNLTDIYVPWAKNAIMNAPWGAENATIHYGYRG